MLTRKKAKRILRWYRFCRFICVLALLVCICAALSSYYLTQEAYTVYISLSPATHPDIRAASYQQAIQLRPEQLEAYILLLDVYGEDGSFAKAESEIFLSAYNRNHLKFDSSDINYSLLHQKAGMLYTTGYEDRSVASRLKLALPFLKIASETMPEQDTNASAVRCYYQIGRYYQEYVWTAGSDRKEVPKEQMEQLIAEIRQTLARFSAAAPPFNIYDRLCFDIAVCDLLYTQRNTLSGSVDRMDIESILNGIYGTLPTMDSLQKEQTKQLLHVLQSNKETYYEMTIRAFDRKEDIKNGPTDPLS